jgi:hypothetical protein
MKTRSYSMLVAALCLVFWRPLGAAPKSTDYYVSTHGSDSTGNGSIAHPWATIAYASKHIGPGATVHVAAGVYRGSFTTRSSGTPSAYITYIADSADFSHPVNCAQVTANHGSLSSCARLEGTSGGTWSNLGNYVTIQGFDVTGPDIGLGRLGIATLGRDTRIIGNSVHDIETSSCGSEGNAGIGPDGENGFVEGNYVYDIGPRVCRFTQGIYPNGSSTGTTIIENNIVFNVSSFGIQSWGNEGGDIIVNNTIFHTGDGCIVLGADAAGRTNAHDYVANNICYATPDGIEENGYSSRATGKDNIYTHNLFYSVRKSYALQNHLRGKATIDASPLFVHYTGDRTGDYHLQAESPARCAGTPNHAPARNFDGHARPRGHCWSVGAYE